MGGQRKGVVASDMGGRSSVFRTSAVRMIRSFFMKLCMKGDHLDKWTFIDMRKKKVQTDTVVTIKQK